MPVKIAGYNIDADLIERLTIFLDGLEHNPEFENSGLPSEIRSLIAEDNMTPETLSAAYARISRDPKPINELRKIARESVARARRSNENIVFGMGHASVAEHAVFNVDVTGISRLAVESIQARRLMSFTEKSQRYIALSREYIIPPELEDSDLGKRLSLHCEKLFESYLTYLPVLEQYFKGKKIEKPEYLAREDARYLLPLASAAQLGMTANARSIEHLLRKTVAHPLLELRIFAGELKTNAQNIAPSLIKYVDEENAEAEKSPELSEIPSDLPEVQLLNSTENADAKLIASIMFTDNSIIYDNALKKAGEMNESGRKNFIQTYLKDLKSFQPVSRQFETIEFEFQVIISSAGYGQLKRHRMATQFGQPYNPGMGYTVPESIANTELLSDFEEKMEFSRKLHDEIFELYPFCAPYALTNAHRKIIYFKANAREMYHLARLRLDMAAQWDIRNIVGKMIKLAREKAPLTLALACGKDEFDMEKADFYG